MTEDEQRQLKDLHDFFMKPPLEGRPNRAQQIDDILNAVRSGKMTFRVMIWVAGAMVAVLATYGQVKAWFTQ